MSPWAARVPVPLRLPALRVVDPLTVRIVPAAMLVVARKSTALRVWLPVMVPPAKTSVEVPAFSPPAVYVQLLAVRMVPARVRVPDALLTTTSGSAPATVVAAPVSGPSRTSPHLAIAAEALNIELPQAVFDDLSERFRDAASA